MTRTCVRDDATEALVRCELIRHGLTVLEPVGTHHPFDVAVLLGGRSILRIQCKTARLRSGCLLFNSCSTDHGAGRLDYGGRADLFAVGDLDARRVYVVDVQQAATRSTSLRLVPTRNGQRERVLFAEDHTLERWVSTLPTTAVRESIVT